MDTRMGRSRSRAISILAFATLLGGVSTSAATRAAQAAPPVARAAPTLSPNPSASFNRLSRVSADSGTDAWAVGDYHNKRTRALDTLILHWNGTAWSKVKSPNPSASFNHLFGVSADSTSDAWAVGSYENNTGGHTLIMHWNGTAWSRVKNPRPRKGILSDVSADSATDAWAVGEHQNNRTGTEDTLIFHWNGTDWSRINSPSPGSFLNQLDGVTADSGTDAWAVGQAQNNDRVSHTLILHWNGTAWSRIKSPNPSSTENNLFGVSADSGTDAWAVGSTGLSALILHWNGTAWSKVKSPSSSALGGVSALSGTDAWAVGHHLTNDATLILHWNGTAWSKIKSPSPSSDFNGLSGVSADSATDAWAVGLYTNDRTSAFDTLILHWNGTAWSRT